MSNDEAGLVLIGVTLVFALLGYLLSTAGLRQAKDQVESVASNAQQAAAQATQAVAQAQRNIAQETGPQATQVAADTATVAQSTTVIQDQLGEVNAALQGLTGPQAPARVAWSLCVFSLLFALVAFDLIALDMSPDADAPAPAPAESR